MFQPKHIQHLTVKKLFLYKDAPYMIYRHQVDGDHINHIHDHDFLELVMISEGTGTQSTPSCDIPMRTGALFVLQPGVWHAYLDCKALLVNVCLIDTRVFDSELAWMRDNPLLHCLLWEAAITESQTPIHYLNAQQTNTGKRAFYALQALEQIQTPQVRARQIGQLITFLVDVADWVSMKTSLKSQEPHIAGLPDAVEQTVMLFSENISCDWSITNLSKLFGLSTPYYIRLFKKTMGEAPLAYLSKMRARRAAQLLMCTDKSIMDVGEEVGWGEPGYFSRRFRYFFGISPRTYRQKYSDFGRDTSHRTRGFRNQ